MQQKSSMDLSGRKLDALPPEVVGEAVEANVQRIDLSKNRFKVVPDELNFPPLLSAVHEVDMSANVLEAAPAWMSAAASLQYLNLGNNREG